MLKPAYWKLFNFYLYVEEPWKGSVPEVYHKRTTDGSYLGVIDPNRDNIQTFPIFHILTVVIHDFP